MPKNKSWKSNLLHSGIPLEHEVAKQVNDINFKVWGEFSYSRVNENKIEKNFSVDIWAVKNLSRSDMKSTLSISCLIECKYAHPGKKWIFVPSYSPDFESLISIIDFSSPYFPNDRSLNQPTNKEYEICLKGTELHDKDATDYIIKKGINQLGYALPNMIKYFTSNQFTENRSHIPIVIPILVTTCDIYVLKKDLTIDDFLQSDNLEEVAEQRDSLIYYQHSNPSLEKYTENILKKFHIDEPSFYEYYEDLYNSKNEHRKESADNYLKRSFKEAHRKILVCNISELQKTLLELNRTIENANFESISDWA